MTVTFCGHGDIQYGSEIKKKLYEMLENLINQGADEFLLGGYGNFDMMAAHTVRDLKEQYPNIQSVFVMPYLNREYDTALYDETIYPDIEHIPKRLAIIKRNEYMVDAADVVIAYVEHGWGGAAKTMMYAIKKGKQIVSLCENSRSL